MPRASGVADKFRSINTFIYRTMLKKGDITLDFNSNPSNNNQSQSGGRATSNPASITSNLRHSSIRRLSVAGSSRSGTALRSSTGDRGSGSSGSASGSSRSRSRSSGSRSASRSSSTAILRGGNVNGQETTVGNGGHVNSSAQRRRRAASNNGSPACCAGGTLKLASFRNGPAEVSMTVLSGDR